MGIISVVAIYGLGEIGFLAGYAVPYAVVGVVSTYLFTKALPGFNVIGRTDWKTVKELVDFSLPISVSNATGFVIRSSDIFLVLYFLSNEAVGAYGVVYSLSQLVRMFSTAFNFLGMPVASKLESDENLSDALRVNESILRWLAVLSAPAVFPMLVYPEFIISFIYGQDYTAGSAALVVLASGFAIHNVFSPNRSLLTATGHTKTMMGNNIVTSALNLILNLVLIPQYGVLGAAIATIAAYLFRDAVVVLELRVFTGKFTVTSRVINPILIAIPTIAVMGYFALEIEATVYSLILLTTCTSVIYVALVIVILGIMPEEQMLVDSVEEKYGISFWIIDKIVDRFSTK
jgi:O-antigen/teichoic acid export membrane protein